MPGATSAQIRLLEAALSREDVARARNRRMAAEVEIMRRQALLRRARKNSQRDPYARQAIDWFMRRGVVVPTAELEYMCTAVGRTWVKRLWRWRDRSRETPPPLQLQPIPRAGRRPQTFHDVEREDL
jgi:hypothetical protein